MSNEPVLKAMKMLHSTGIELLVQTIYMPDIVDKKEIEKIAEFLSTLDKNLKYRISPFSPTFAYEKVTREPIIEEMECAYEIASKYLPNAVVSGGGCAREYFTPPSQETWITVYPDLTFRRRTMEDQNEERIKWLSSDRPREEIIQDGIREVEVEHDKILRTMF